MNLCYLLYFLKVFYVQIWQQVTLAMPVHKQREIQQEEKLATLYLSPPQGVYLFQSCRLSLMAEHPRSLELVALKTDEGAIEIVRAACMIVKLSNTYGCCC